MVTCVDRADGESRWQQRLGDACWATPIVSGGRAYFFTKSGKTVVLGNGAHGPEILAESALSLSATVYGVAAAHDAFLVRTGHELIKLAEPAGQIAGPLAAP